MTKLSTFWTFLFIAFFVNLVFFIVCYNYSNSILQYHHIREQVLNDSFGVYMVDIRDLPDLRLSPVFFVLFGIDFLLLLFSVEYLKDSFYEVFNKKEVKEQK